MLRVSSTALSRPQKQHFRKRIPNFYAPYYGASFMKSYPVIPYERLGPSLHHYPEVSKVTGKKINWMFDTPKSGYEAVNVYGPYTIEVTGLPMLKTPEYLQERLRRYFSKFGAISMCRAVNHPLDPYQCDGTAFVTFREFASAENAVHSLIKLPVDMGHKQLTLRGLWNDHITNSKKEIEETTGGILQLVEHVEEKYRKGLESGAPVHFNDELVLSNLLSLSEFADSVKPMFIRAVDGDGTTQYVARQLIDFDKNIERFKKLLEGRFTDKLSVPWRSAAPVKELPEYTQRRIKMWDKKNKLPFDLQILSRDYRQYKIHDEKFLVNRRKTRDLIQTKRSSRKELLGSSSTSRNKAGGVVV